MKVWLPASDWKVLRCFRGCSNDNVPVQSVNPDFRISEGVRRVSEVVLREDESGAVLVEPLSVLFIFGVIFGDEVPKRVCMVGFAQMSEFVDDDVVDDVRGSHH